MACDLDKVMIFSHVEEKWQKKAELYCKKNPHAVFNENEMGIIKGDVLVISVPGHDISLKLQKGKDWVFSH